VAIGKAMEDENPISFIISGLNPMCNNFFTTLSFTTREHGMSFDDFQEQLLNHEMLNKQQTVVADSSAFALFNKRTGPQNFNQKRKYQPVKSQPQNHGLNQFSSNGPPATTQHSYSAPSNQSKTGPETALINHSPSSANFNSNLNHLAKYAKNLVTKP
jgi:hypothetical protein